MRTILFSILLTILIVPTSAETRSLPTLEEEISHLPESQQVLLRSGGEIVIPINHKTPLTLPPVQLEPKLQDLHDSMNKSFGVEVLLYLPFDDYEDRENINLNIYNALRQVSTLEGQEYYSQRRGERTVLFHQFYSIEDEDSRTPLGDPKYDEVPLREDILIFQEDATFGEAVFRMSFESNDDIISLTLANLTNLWLSIIPIAQREELILNAQIIPTTEGIVFYGLCQAEGNGVPGLNSKVTESLKNRIIAIFQWFSQNTTTL